MARQYLGFGISVAVAYLGGWLLGKKLKVPAGRMIGAMLAVAALEIITNIVWYPQVLFYLVKVMAGVFIGVRFQRQDVTVLKRLALPFVIMIVSMFLLNIALSKLIDVTTTMDQVTALLATAPGGLTEMTIFAVDFQADAALVSAMHICRVILVIGLFPQFARLFARLYHRGHPRPDAEATGEADQDEVPEAKQPVIPLNVTLTLLVATVGGWLGNISGISGGVMVGSTLATVAFSLSTGRASMPLQYRWSVQMFAGLIIGSGMTMASLHSMRGLGLAVLIMMVGYLILWLLLSFALVKLARMDIETAMLSTSPAGASDMSLLALDMGGNSSQVSAMQMLRLVTVITVFPMLFHLVF